MKNNFGSNLPVINLYKKKSLKSGIDTQLLYGDNFKVIKKHSGWKKIRIKKDGYIGKSVQAYKRIYPLIVKALERGDGVTIEYVDLD